MGDFRGCGGGETGDSFDVGFLRETCDFEIVGAKGVAPFGDTVSLEWFKLGDVDVILRIATYLVNSQQSDTARYAF